MYKPMIVRDDGEHYLYCKLGGLPEIEQERLKDELTKLIELYQSSNQRTKDWLSKAEVFNAEWRKNHELSDLANS